MNDFSFYFGLGWEHIMSWDALDHILFVLVLAAVYLPSDWKKVLILVTAFTIGHSITLALSTLNVLSVSSAWVEFLIPCTIVLTAFLNLFQRKFDHRAIRLNYFLALFFGLIHGLGFANTLRFVLAIDQNLGWALFGFNVGLEAGQIIIVALILLAAFLFVQMLRVPRREWVLILSAAVFSLSLQMALERIP
ncbi:HupE/UreJ family protein [Paracnuella aquatica]|uniref:HupE/UreJ family protein n=1 Tax=Paracnuella aquatica TaxID=2268757 RepID=UPI000DEF3C0C|nr:HupE/UreJ family protein [Paracnuella aquatica]RPD51789.1 HupE/UreJ family protein [Paracnuella aquatica]